MSFDRKEAVICDLNKDELRGLQIILYLAERGLPGYFNPREHWLVEAMIKELRKVFWPEGK